MWGRAAVVENEMMFHTAQSNGPAALRKPAGLALDSVMEQDLGHHHRVTTPPRIAPADPFCEHRELLVRSGGCPGDRSVRTLPSLITTGGCRAHGSTRPVSTSNRRRSTTGSAMTSAEAARRSRCASRRNGRPP